MYELCQRDKGERGRQKRNRRSASETRFTSGEFEKFIKSPWRFVTDTPIAGPFKPGQARKTAGHNTAEKKIIFSTLFIYMTIGEYSNLFFFSRKCKREEKSVQDSKTIPNVRI